MSGRYGGAGAHYWAREIQKLGHTARLMSPHFVTAYRKNQKNDGNDAEAICEAVGRPSMRFVPIKSASQQDIQAVHRIRFQLIKWRTALANKVRGLLGEYGIVVAQGIASLRRELPLILDDEPIERSLPRDAWRDGRTPEAAGPTHPAACSRVERGFGQDERCPRLAQVEGVGPLVATALVAAIGNAHEFKNGCELSAWLGLVPRQQRWSQCALGYQQAWRPLSAHAAHSWSALRDKSS
jgi:transposase